MNAAPPLHVLVVDDSAVVRAVMSQILTQEADMTVTVASDPLFALHKMKYGRPDVIILDLQMPRMDGITFLRKIMAEEPIPVVVCSGFTGPGSDLALQALDAGAIEIITKENLGVQEFLLEASVRIIDAVRGAAMARRRPAVKGEKKPAPPAPAPAPVPKEPPAPAKLSEHLVTDSIIAIGASTGGPDALREVLSRLPASVPGILIVQHMPALFTASFAKRLNDLCKIEVMEARDGDRLFRGRALIAPGNHHMFLHRYGERYFVEIKDGPLVSRHRPSVDVLFHSVAQCAGPKAVGLIMTGMGGDGSDGLLAMRKAGARTLAQDEASCVVYGMPKVAVEKGAVEETLALENIARRLVHLTRV